jgi:hypothetical protein
MIATFRAFPNCRTLASPPIERALGPRSKNDPAPGFCTNAIIWCGSIESVLGSTVSRTESHPRRAALRLRSHNCIDRRATTQSQASGNSL